MSPSEPIIIVEVGSPAIEFRVREALLVEHSAFFRAALSGRFIESQTRRFHLHEDGPVVFQRPLGWMDSGILDVNDDEDDENDEDEEEAEDGAARQPTEEEQAEMVLDGVHKLFELWILCDKLLVPQLQNIITTALLHLATPPDVPCPRIQIPGTETLELVFDNTHEASRLRALAVDMAVLTGAAHGLVQSMATLPHEILLAVATRAVTFWNEETTCVRVSKHRYLAYAHENYEAGTALAAGPLVLPCNHLTALWAIRSCDSCHCQRTQGAGHLPWRNVALRWNDGTPYLQAECSNGKQEWVVSTINLDKYIGNIDGDFVWVYPGGSGGFSKTARAVELVEDEKVLVAELQRRHGSWRKCRIVLSTKIINCWGQLKYLHRA